MGEDFNYREEVKKLDFGPISRWVSLNQARAKQSLKYSGSAMNFSQMARYFGSTIIAMSASVIIGLTRLDGSLASTGMCSSFMSTGSHWLAPAGLLVNCHS